jgi:hypothetical protein
MTFKFDPAVLRLLHEYIRRNPSASMRDLYTHTGIRGSDNMWAYINRGLVHEEYGEAFNYWKEMTNPRRLRR